MDAAIVWFRQDLRLSDNPALHAAIHSADNIIPLYIHNEDESGKWPLGSASRWWLHYSLQSLDTALQKRGSRLIIRHGNSLKVLLELAERTGATHIYCNALYEPSHSRRDHQVKSALRSHAIQVHEYHGNLLFSPDSISNKSGLPYKVFTPFYRACLAFGIDSSVLRKPKKMAPVSSAITSIKLQSLGLLPQVKWYTGFSQRWKPGEDGATNLLKNFTKHHLNDYIKSRDFPAIKGTTNLSPHLHFGEISPRQIVAKLEQTAATTGLFVVRNTHDAVIRQLIWRDFAHHILVHFPYTTDKPFNPSYEKFPWRQTHKSFFKAWQKGATGIPIIDAGMRELWQSGFMHNRVRMIVASLLTKNANLHWLNGARWFWDTLVDADLANNSLNWQWVAGCGVDAAPYFRIFNPVTQGKRFDPDGDYIRRWIPELDVIPARYIHEPWKTPVALQQQLNIQIGKDYPQPILDLSTTRQQALANYHRSRRT